MTNRANAEVSRILGELFGLPLQGMTRIVVTAEVRKAPTVDVSYLVVGPRAVSLAETQRLQRGTRHFAIREQYRLVPNGPIDEEKSTESTESARGIGIAGGVPDDPTRGGQNLSRGG